jgi:hypothetical protein
MITAAPRSNDRHATDSPAVVIEDFAKLGGAVLSVSVAHVEIDHDEAGFAER